MSANPLLNTQQRQDYRGMVLEMAAEVIPEIAVVARYPAALTASAGSDAANIRLKAERKGDVFVLNGEKTSISMAHQTLASCSPAQARRRSALTALPFRLNSSSQGWLHLRLGSGVVGRGSSYSMMSKCQREHGR